MDSVIVSKMEFDNVIVWNERLNATMCIGPNKKDGTGREYKPRLKKLNPKNPAKPAAAKTEDEDGKNPGGAN